MPFKLLYNNEFVSLKMLNAGRRFFPEMVPIADKSAVNTAGNRHIVTHAYLILGPVPGGIAVCWPLYVTELNFISCVHRTNIEWKFHLQEFPVLLPVYLYKEHRNSTRSKIRLKKDFPD